MPQLALLLASFTVIEFGWYVTYAAGGSRIARHLKSERMQRATKRVVGMLFAAFGLVLLKWRPA